MPSGDQGFYYDCMFPAFIQGWRKWFGDPGLPFGFVQIASFNYGGTVNAADLRQGQLSGLKANRSGPVFMSTAIDTGDWYSQHPSDKQTPARYLANQALKYIYRKNVGSNAVDFPMFAGQKVSSVVTQADGSQSVAVTVTLRAAGAPVPLTTTIPFATTQSSLLGCAHNQSCLTPSNCGNNYVSPISIRSTFQNLLTRADLCLQTWGSVPRNKCVTSVFPPPVEHTPKGQPRTNKCLARDRCATPANCGYPAIIGTDGTSLNATASIGSDSSTIVLKADAPAGFVVAATSYGRADWPMTTFFSEHGALPVIPWYSGLSETAPFFTNATGVAPARRRHKTDDILSPPPACDCDGFCSGKCSLPTAAGPPATLTLYRLTPRNITDLVNKDTGDAEGDAFFTVNEYDLPMRCSQGVSTNARGCFLDVNDIYMAFEVQVDGLYGPYGQ